MRGRVLATAAGLLIAFALPCRGAAQEGPPPFLEEGETYYFQLLEPESEFEAEVIEIRFDAWVRVRDRREDFWLNTATVAAIAPVLEAGPGGEAGSSPEP